MTFEITTLVPARMPEDFVEKFGEFIETMDPTTEAGRKRIIATDAFIRFLDKRRKDENNQLQGLVKKWAEVRQAISPALWKAIDDEGSESSTGGRQIKTPLGSISRAVVAGKPKVVDEEKGVRYLREKVVDETIIGPELSAEIDELVRLRELGYVTIKASLTPTGKKLLEEEFVVAESWSCNADERGNEFMRDKQLAICAATGVERQPEQRQTRITFRNDTQRAEARELMTTVLEEFFLFQEQELELEALDPEMLADFERAMG